MNNWASKINEGDTVVISTPFGFKINTVSRITDTKIIVNTMRFRREDGVMNDSYSILNPSSIYYDQAIKRHDRSLLVKQISNVKWKTLPSNIIEKALDLISQKDNNEKIRIDTG